MGNILHVITKLELGGAQKSTLYLVKEIAEWQDKKHQVFLFTSPGLIDPSAYGIPPEVIIYSRYLGREIHFFNDIRVFFELLKCIQQYSITIVHTHSSKAGILGRWAAYCAGIKRIYHTVHGFSFGQYSPWYERSLYGFLEKITALITTTFIFVSKKDLEKAHSLGLLYKAGALLVRERSIPTHQKRQYEKDRQGKGDIPQKKYVCMIACLKPQKAPLDYIRAAYKVLQQRQDVVFELVGDGPLRGEIESLCAQWGLKKDQCVLYGWQQQVDSFLAKACVVVFTSKWEGLPLVAYEAMSHAKPIVATAVDGLQEAVIDGKTGFLVPAGDYQGIAEKVLYLLDHPQEALRMGREAEKHLSTFSTIDDMVKDILQLYAIK